MRKRCLAILGLIMLMQFSCARPACTKGQWERFSKLWVEDDIFKNSKENFLDECPVHKVKLVSIDVYHMAGMYQVPPRSFILAKLRHFPQSFLVVMTGFCEGRDYCTKYKCCPICRAKEVEWRKQHGWDIPNCSKLSNSP